MDGTTSLSSTAASTSSCVLAPPVEIKPARRRGVPSLPPVLWGPTPERKAKAGDAMTSDVVGKDGDQPLRRHRVKTPLEAYGTDLEAGEFAAIEQFLKDGAVATNVRLTMNYDGDGVRTAPGSRLGGLGEARKEERDAYWRFEKIRARLHPRLLEFAGWMQLEARSASFDGKHLTLEEIGQKLFPRLKDKPTLKGITLGALKCGLAWSLQLLYAEETKKRF
jgi:hypothetical protein